MSRFKREHSAGATTTFTFFSCGVANACLVLRVPILSSSFLVVSLFLSKVFGVICIGPETTPTRRGRDDRDEKDPTTDEKASYEKASSTKPFASRVSIHTY